MYSSSCGSTRHIHRGDLINQCWQCKCNTLLAHLWMVKAPEDTAQIPSTVSITSGNCHICPDSIHRIPGFLNGQYSKFCLHTNNRARHQSGFPTFISCQRQDANVLPKRRQSHQGDKLCDVSTVSLVARWPIYLARGSHGGQRTPLLSDIQDMD